MKYVAYDYEEMGEPHGYWHIYTLDNEPDGVDLGGGSLLTIVGPDNDELRALVVRICEDIDAAIDKVARG